MIQTAFSAPDRVMTARITIDSAVYGPEFISEIKLNRGISLAEQFEVGTAYSQIVTFTLLDETGTVLEGVNFAGKRARIEIGIEDAGTVVYKDLGIYILEQPEKVQKIKWQFEGSDYMIFADKLFVDSLTYPQTIGAIFALAVSQMGCETDTPIFTNSAVSVTTKPQYYDMTIREVLADIAELAGGYCFIEDGKVRIKNIVQDTVTSVTSNNIIDFRRNVAEGITIDKLIIRQQGATDHVTGTGDHPYYINDNVFIQGNPQDYAAGIFNRLNGIFFIPCEVEFNGNPTELLNGWVNLEFLGNTYKVFPAAREIEFQGGMKERWISKYLDNLPHEEAVSDIVRTIKKTNAQLLVMDDTITAKVTQTVGEVGIYKVDIISTNGMIFKNDAIFTTLVARVYKNNLDITDLINSSRFKWTKTNADGTTDEAWNTRYFGGTKQVTLTAEDVNQRASFKCEVLEE